MRQHILFQLASVLICLSAAVAAPKKSKVVRTACDKKLVEDTNALHAHAIGSLYSVSRAKHFMELISGEKPAASGYVLPNRGRYPFRHVSRFLLIELIESMGYTVRVDSFARGANLVVEKAGTTRDGEVVGITAHYDSVGNKGADDNGSGVSLMLAMLEHFQNVESERRLQFVFMDLEESGYVGSEFHASRLKRLHEEDGRTHLGTIVVDTIGWHPKTQKKFLAVLELGHSRMGQGYEERVRFAQECYYIIRRIGVRDNLEISVELDGAMPGTADHGSYWRHGIPGFLFAASFERPFRNPEYHRNDNIRVINWDYYKQTSQTVVEMLAYAARSTLKDPSQLSEKNWSVLRELENKSVNISDPLPGPLHHYDFLDEKNEPPRLARVASSSAAPSAPTTHAAPSGASAYHDYFRMIIRKSKKGSAALFVSADGSSAEVTWGYVVADGGEAFHIVGEPDDFVRDLADIVTLENGGRIFHVSAKHFDRLTSRQTREVMREVAEKREHSDLSRALIEVHELNFVEQPLLPNRFLKKATPVAAPVKPVKVKKAPPAPSAPPKKSSLSVISHLYKAAKPGELKLVVENSQAGSRSWAMFIFGASPLLLVNVPDDEIREAYELVQATKGQLMLITTSDEVTKISQHTLRSVVSEFLSGNEYSDYVKNIVDIFAIELQLAKQLPPRYHKR